MPKRKLLRGREQRAKGKKRSLREDLDVFSRARAWDARSHKELLARTQNLEEEDGMEEEGVGDIATESEMVQPRYWEKGKKRDS